MNLANLLKPYKKHETVIEEVRSKNAGYDVCATNYYKSRLQFTKKQFGGRPTSHHRTTQTPCRLLVGSSIGVVDTVWTWHVQLVVRFELLFLNKFGVNNPKVSEHGLPSIYMYAFHMFSSSLVCVSQSITRSSQTETQTSQTRERDHSKHLHCIRLVYK